MLDTIVGQHLYTVEAFKQFADLPENQDRLLELVHGEIVEKVPTGEHGVLAATIARYLGNYVAPRKLGRVGVEVRHRKPSDKYNVRMPDVLFRAGSDPVVTEGAVPQMPDLAVEIQSPNDRPREMREKAHYYLRNGSKLVWLIYPRKQAFEECRLDAEGEMEVKSLDLEGVLDGRPVLSDFSVPIKEIFEVE
ncbi:MAG: Uma2 family endonuclease [Anaerolineae bacterium]|nr:Uma2 family endonuclease [Anaerolineae bacterium]